MPDTVDVEALARRAGVAARQEAAERALPQQEVLGAARRRRERRRSAAAGAVVVLVLLAGAGVLGQLARDDGRSIDAIGADEDAVRGVLDVPPAGEVAAAWLDDGTPVFVSAVSDEVLVLDPVLTRGLWLPSLVVACERGTGPPTFEGPQHGERWDGLGRWTDGPAPADLGRYAVRPAEDGQVVVLGEPVPADGRSDAEDRPVGAPGCFDTTSGDHVDDTVRHRPEDGVRFHARDLPADRWTWVRVRVASIRGELRVCDDRCVDDDPLLATPVDAEPSGEPSLHLARPTADGRVDLVEQVVAQDRDTLVPLDERSWAQRTWDRVDPWLLAVAGVVVLLALAVVGPVRQRSVTASGGRPRGPRGPSS